MALPSYATIFTDIQNGQFTPQITVALWLALDPILAEGEAATQDQPPVQALYRQILSDGQLPIRIAWRILNTVLAGGQPTDANIQSAVSAIIPASGAFSL